MIEYASIYLKKQWCICQNSDKANAQITEQLLRQTYSEHCQISKMEHFVKRIMPKYRCINGNGRGEVCATRALQ